MADAGLVAVLRVAIVAGSGATSFHHESEKSTGTLDGSWFAQVHIGAFSSCGWPGFVLGVFFADNFFSDEEQSRQQEDLLFRTAGERRKQVTKSWCKFLNKCFREGKLSSTKH